MPYYCPYCKTSLTHDSFSVRKSHRHGQKHVRLREEYYQRVIAEHPESVTLEQELASVNPLERIFAGMPGSQKQYFEQDTQKRVLTVPPTSASLPAPPPYVYFTLDAVAVPEKRVNIERRDDEGHGHGYGFGRRGYRGRGGSHGQGRGHLRGRGRGSGRGSGSDGGRGDVVDVVDVAMGVVMGAVTEVERGTDGHTVPMALGITMVMPMPIMDTTAIVVATTTRANEGGTQRLVGSGTMGGPLFPYRLNDYLNRSE